MQRNNSFSKKSIFSELFFQKATQTFSDLENFFSLHDGQPSDSDFVIVHQVDFQIHLGELFLVTFLKIYEYSFVTLEEALNLFIFFFFNKLTILNSFEKKSPP
jgi:hypothetical protein